MTENTLLSSCGSKDCKLPDLLAWRSLPEGDLAGGLGGEVSASNLARSSVNFRLADLPALGAGAPFQCVA